MKNKKLSKFILATSFVTGALIVNAQNTFPDPGPGSAGVGIASPNADFQLYSAVDYVTPVGRFNPGVNLGKTSRMLLTNSTSGSATTDGLEIRFSELNGFISNLEGKSLTLSSGASSLTFDGLNSRINSGFTPASNALFGKFNILSSSDNGMYIRTIANNKYALKLEVINATTNAIQIVNTTNVNENNFTVNGAGQVYARRYTTTLANIPDYVFDADYKLLTIAELEEYIANYNHLPNIPSAAEYTEEGVDLGELNRLLLEKVEELTLYVIQLHNEIELLKETK